MTILSIFTCFLIKMTVLSKSRKNLWIFDFFDFPAGIFTNFWQILKKPDFLIFPMFYDKVLIFVFLAFLTKIAAGILTRFWQKTSKNRWFFVKFQRDNFFKIFVKKWKKNFRQTESFKKSVQNRKMVILAKTSKIHKNDPISSQLYF